MTRAVMNDKDRKLVRDYLADPTQVALPSRIVDLLAAHFAAGQLDYERRMREANAGRTDSLDERRS